jgi:hypothetical protein
MKVFSIRTNTQALGDESSRGFIVRPIEPPSRPTVTPIERLAVSNLRREGVISLQLLVERVATELYHEELRKGAWALDIGLFGGNLFVSDVMNEIKAQDGTLWQIEKPGE